MIAELFARWLSDFYLLATLLLAAALIAGWFVLQPARRVALTRATLVGLALLAVLCALPGWSAVHLMTREVEAIPVVIAPEPMATEVAVVLPPVELPMEAAPIIESAIVEAAPVSSSAEAFTLREVSVSIAVVATYLVGSFFVVLWQLLGHWRARALVRGSTPASAELQKMLSELRGATVLSPPPPAPPHRGEGSERILISPNLPTAVALGTLRPVILLPHKLVESTDSTALRTILAHELAHIRHGDLRLLALCRALFVLLWANPLFWVLRRRLRLDQETLADAEAAEVTTRHRYAEQLVDWAKRFATDRPPALAAAVGLWESPSQLRQRIAVLLDERLTIWRECSRRWRIASLAVCAGVAVGLSLVTLEPASSGADNLKSNAIDYKADDDTSATAKSVGSRVLKGQIFDQSGQSIAGAKLWLILRLGVDQLDGWMVRGESGPDGTYALEVPEKWLAPGDFWPDSTLWCYSPNHELASKNASRQLFHNANEPIEIALSSATDTTFVVTSPEGTPLDGAMVEPWHYLAGSYNVAPTELRRLLGKRTNKEGRVLLPNLGRQALKSINVIDAKYGTQRKELEDSANVPAERTVQLRSTGQLQGRLIASDLAAVANRRITIEGREVGLNMRGVAETTTDENGHFEIDAIAWGSVDIHIEQVESSDFIPRIPDAVEVVADRETRMEIPLERGVAVRGLIRTRKEHKPVPNALISVRTIYGRQIAGGVVRSNSEGKFTTRVLEGTVNQGVIMRPPEFENWIQIESNQVDRVKVSMTTEIVELPPIELVRTIEVKGVVLDDKDRPIPKVRLSAITGNRVYSGTYSDDEGRFTLRRPDGIEIDKFEVHIDRNPGHYATIEQKEPLVLRVEVDQAKQAENASRESSRENPTETPNSLPVAPWKNRDVSKFSEDATEPNASNPSDKTTSTLTARFLFDGPIPKPREIELPKSASDAKEFGPIFDQSLTVGEEGGIANVFVWVRSKDIPMPPAAKLPPVRVSFENGRYAPHALAFQAPRELVVVNESQFGINANYMGMHSPANLVLPTGKEQSFQIKPESLPCKLIDNIHPWVSAVLFAAPNPYFAVSDESGTIRIENLPLGEWEFVAWHERVGYLNTENWPRGRFKVAVKAGENELGTIKLAGAGFEKVTGKLVQASETKAPELAAGNPQANTISGSCVDENGKPLSGVKVSLYINTMSGREQKSELKSELTTGADGMFRFNDVVGDSNEAERKKANYDNVTVVVVARKSGRASAPSMSASTHVKSTGETSTLVLTPAGKLSGQVTDPQGKPVAGARVTFGLSQLRLLIEDETVTDTDGRYTIDDTPIFDLEVYRRNAALAQSPFSGIPREARSSVVLPALPPLTVTHPNFASSTVGIESVPGTADVELKPAAIVEGRVLYGDSGQPAEGVYVSANASQPKDVQANPNLTLPSSLATVRTDADGRYKIATLPAGTYDIWAESDEGWLHRGVGDIKSDGKKPTTLDDFQLTRGGLVEVRFVDAKNSKPISFDGDDRAMILLVPTDRLRSRPLSAGQFPAVKLDGIFPIHTLPGEHSLFLAGVQSELDWKWHWKRVKLEDAPKVKVIEGKTVTLDVPVERGGPRVGFPFGGSPFSSPPVAKARPNDEDAARELAAKLTEAVELSRTGKPEEALMRFDAILKDHPDHFTALIGRTEAWDRMGEYRKEVAELERIIKLNPPYPTNVIAYNNWAYILATANDETVRDGKRAVVLAEKAMQLAQQPTPDLFDTLAAAFAEAGDFERAIVAQNEAIKRAPDRDEFRESLKLYEAGKPRRGLSPLPKPVSE